MNRCARCKKESRQGLAQPDGWVCFACFDGARRAKGGDDNAAAVGPPRGLGDTIARATSAVGVRPCSGCKKRQATLNRLFPYSPPEDT